MALIKYVGTSHFRQLLAADFKKAGVEVKAALTFARHEVTEVADDVADALHKLVGDEFEKVSKDTNEEIRDLTDETKAPEPQVQGPAAPTSEWVTRTEEPVTDATIGEPSATA